LGARLAHHNVGRKRTGAGREIKLHHYLLESAGHAGGADLAWAGWGAQAAILLTWKRDLFRTGTLELGLALLRFR
jgi:hypothetical protein